jgi:hypothetical protein
MVHDKMIIDRGYAARTLRQLCFHLNFNFLLGSASRTGQAPMGDGRDRNPPLGVVR